MPKRGPGQPQKYRKDFHPDDFIRMSEQGKTLAQIARAWKVDRHTIQNWQKRHKEFLAAVKKGREIAEAWYMDLGQLAMLGQATIDGKKINVNLGWFVWMTKNMFKWSDKMSVKPEPEENTHRPLAHLTDEELDEL